MKDRWQRLNFNTASLYLTVSGHLAMICIYFCEGYVTEVIVLVVMLAIAAAVLFAKRDKLDFKLFESPKPVSVVDTLSERIPALKQKVSCPGCWTGYSFLLEDKKSIRFVIMELNDFHGWSREKIADWLETLDDNFSFN